MKKSLLTDREFEESKNVMEDKGTSIRYVLKLCIIGITPRAKQAIVKIRELCDEHLRDCYELEIVDLAQFPEMAIGEQIIATPTLIKKLPLPSRRFIGDMTHIEHILRGLDIKR